MADDPKPGADPAPADDEELDPAVDPAAADDPDADPDLSADVDPDADPDADPDPDPDADPDTAPSRRSEGRANRTVRELRERARAAERQRDEAIAARNGGGPSAHQQAQEYERAEAAKLAAAEEAERMGTLGATARYWNERTVREARGVTQFSQNQAAERADASEFRVLAREVPGYAAVKDEVEAHIQQQRAQGNFALSREVYATYLLGKRAVERAVSGNGRQRQRADGQRLRQVVRAPQGGNDAPAPRGRRVKSSDDLSAEDFEHQFGNQPIR